MSSGTSSRYLVVSHDEPKGEFHFDIVDAPTARAALRRVTKARGLALHDAVWLCVGEVWKLNNAMLNKTPREIAEKFERNIKEWHRGPTKQK